MKHRLFNAAALLSGLLFAWACWAWVRSYQPRHLVVEASEGRVFLVFWEHTGTRLTDGFEPGGTFAERAHLLRQELMRRSRGRGWDWMGFGFVQGRTPSVHFCRIVSIPFWFVTIVAAIIPAARGVRVVRQRRRVRERRCLKCGYDLRASGERCPECGTAVATAGTAVAV